MNWQKIFGRIVVVTLSLVAIPAVLQLIPILLRGEIPSFSDIAGNLFWLVMCLTCIIACLTRRRSWAVAGLLSILWVLVTTVEFSLSFAKNYSIALTITVITSLYMVTILLTKK